ncbi:MAG TPA: ArsA family ATPase [Pseudonocardiaceae bacterium]
MVRVVLFAGKGGVGKTTLAAATAASMSAAGRKTLIVSTDPAHSLSDVLNIRLGHDPSEVDDGLFASQLDSGALLGDAWSTVRTHLATVLAGAGVNEMVAEELTVLPGVEELLALSEVQRMTGAGPWEVVVVDCAPTAETLRLLALPEVFAGYLERLFPTHRRVVRGMLAGLAGPNSSAQRWDAAADALGNLVVHLESLRALIADPTMTTVRLVLTPERVVAAETRRSVTALALQGVRVDGLLVNRLVPKLSAKARGPAADWVRTRRREQEAVLAALSADFPGMPVRTVEHCAAEPVGLAALRELTDDLRGGADIGDGLLDLMTGAPPEPMLTVTGAGGSGLDARFQLRLALPLLDAEGLELCRVADDLAVTVAGHRRLVALPSVLRRCTVIGAEVDAAGLLVWFKPDPAVWMR